MTEIGSGRVHLNHLIHETSPYLLQHAHNPVDWHPWGEAALALAKKEDKPIFLSIGYAACHWCHVMERESFENEDIAGILNEHFVSVKVDREERPDLDEIYMTATVAMTGAGGWPMSVFLTPDLKPFYCGTYYPPEDRFGRPGFATVLLHVLRAWKEQREEILRGAEGLTQYLRRQLGQAIEGDRELSEGLIAGAVEQLTVQFDPHDGGWGGAPKFPASATIMLLLRAHRRSGNEHALHMASHTLDCMARGGIWDHLGGGFARYAVDETWLVPHFEKMLYDNAQLAAAYLEAFQVTGAPRYGEVAHGIFQYVLRDMRGPGGAFYSSEDADSDGEEGKFYLWSEAEIREALAPEDADIFAAAYGVRPEGNFSSHESYHAGQNILHRREDCAALAQRLSLPEAQVRERLAQCRARLFELREERTRPGLDDKTLTSWNGLMITALARGARILDAPEYADAAAAAAGFILREMRRADGALLRTSREGASRLPGYLDDYAFLANGLVDLYEATFDPEWLLQAGDLAEGLLSRFWDESAGNCFFTSDEHRDVLVRTKPTYDGAEPSGNSVAAEALLRLAALLDRPDYREKARRILESGAPGMAKAPMGFTRMLCALDRYLHPIREVVLVGSGDAEALRPLARVAHAVFAPDAVFAGMDGASARQTEFAAASPLLRGKTAVDGKPAAYVCRAYRCDAPETDPEALRAKLAAPAV